jgi:heme/copper-type cytochrome/quinol oxidase subunit 4
MSVRLPEAARSTTVVWVVLSAITVVSWWLGPARHSGPPAPSTVITVVVLALGFIKARLIIRYFMEVRTAPLWLRVSTDVWLVALWGGVLGIYLY